jgi:hypothetical protein
MTEIMEKRVYQQLGFISRTNICKGKFIPTAVAVPVSYVLQQQAEANKQNFHLLQTTN